MTDKTINELGAGPVDAANLDGADVIPFRDESAGATLHTNLTAVKTLLESLGVNASTVGGQTSAQLAGNDGLSILTGTTDPGPGDGVDGQVYIRVDLAGNAVSAFGPKASGAWPAGVSLIGPQGPAGSATSLNAGAGLFDTGGDTRNVNVDGATLEISSDEVRVKPAGISASQLADDSVATAKIATNAVTTAKIAADAVTGAKIANDAIDATHLADDSVRNAQLLNGTITAVKLANSSITSAKLADAAVTTAGLADAAVTLAKFGVTADQLVALLNTAGATIDTSVAPGNSGGGSGSPVTSRVLVDHSSAGGLGLDAAQYGVYIIDVSADVSAVTAANVTDGFVFTVLLRGVAASTDSYSVDISNLAADIDGIDDAAAIPIHPDTRIELSLLADGSSYLPSAIVHTAGTPDGTAVMFVVEDPASPTGYEAAAKTLLEAAGHTVTYQDVDDAEAATTGFDVAILSQSPVSGDYNTKYTNGYGIPTVNLEAYAWDAEDLVNADPTIPTEADVVIADAAHPIAAGLAAGTATVYSPASQIWRNAPAEHHADAAVIATSDGNSAVFAFDVGDNLIGGGTANKRRVAFGLAEIDNLTTDGEAMFLAAVEWAAASA